MFKTAPSLFLQKWTSLLFTKTVSTLCSGGIGSQFGEKFGLLVFVQCTLYNVCLCVQLHIHCDMHLFAFVTLLNPALYLQVLTVARLLIVQLLQSQIVTGYIF